MNRSLKILVAFLVIGLLLSAAFEGYSVGKGKRKRGRSFPTPRGSAIKVKGIGGVKGKIVRLNHLYKVIVFNRAPLPAELDALSRVNNLVVSIELDNAPDKALWQVLGSFDNLNYYVKLPVSLTEKDAQAAAELGSAVLVFDATGISSIPEDFYYIQADYLPFVRKIVRFSPELISERELKTMLDLRSFNVEVVLEKPLTSKQIRILKKVLPNVRKQFFVPYPFKKRALKALSKLKHVSVSFDLRNCQNLKKALKQLQRTLPRLSKGIVISGPFDEEVASTLSLWENLAELRVVISGEMPEEFVYLLNRKK